MWPILTKTRLRRIEGLFRRQWLKPLQIPEARFPQYLNSRQLGERRRNLSPVQRVPSRLCGTKPL